MDRSTLNAKRFDTYGQLCIALIPLALSALYAPIMFISLFGLGAWQLISYFGNTVSDDSGRTAGLRRIYGAGLALLLLFGIGAVLIKSLLYPFLVTGLGAALVLGVFYIVLSAIELTRMRSLLQAESGTETDGDILQHATRR